jgi:peptidoglycan/LPS O-acetylase OafA/YrhL
MVIMFVVLKLRMTPVTDIVVGVANMCALVVCGHTPKGILSRIASWPPIAAIGTFSYSLYLIHFPIQQVLWQHFVLPLNLGKVATFFIVATLGTAAIIGLSYLFYLVFERPFCNSRSRMNVTPLFIFQREIVETR